MSTATTKPKQRLCCMMRPIGECIRCKKIVCKGHGRANYAKDYMGHSRLTTIECRSPKCNDSVVKDRQAAERRRYVFKELLGRVRSNSRGKALLDRLSSQKVHQSISKISQRKRHR